MAAWYYHIGKNNIHIKSEIRWWQWSRTAYESDNEINKTIII